MPRPKGAVRGGIRFRNRFKRVKNQEHLVATFEEQVPAGFLRKRFEPEYRLIKYGGPFEIVRVKTGFQNRSNPRRFCVGRYFHIEISAGSARVPAEFGLGCTNTRPFLT